MSTFLVKLQCGHEINYITTGWVGSPVTCNVCGKENPVTYSDLNNMIDQYTPFGYSGYSGFSETNKIIKNV